MDICGIAAIFGIASVGASVFGFIVFFAQGKRAAKGQARFPPIPPSLGEIDLPLLVTDEGYVQRLATPGGELLPCITVTTVCQSTEMSRLGVCYANIQFGLWLSPDSEVSVSGDMILWGGHSIVVDEIKTLSTHPNISGDYRLIEFSTFARLMPTKSIEKT